MCLDPESTISVVPQHFSPGPHLSRTSRVHLITPHRHSPETPGNGGKSTTGLRHVAVHTSVMTSLTITPTDLVATVLESFSATWPGLTLNLFDARSPDIYKDISYEPYRLAGHAPVSARTAPVELRGDMTPSHIRDELYMAYAVESDVDNCSRDETLDTAARRARG